MGRMDRLGKLRDCLSRPGFSMPASSPVVGPSLKHWDEATALAGLHFWLSPRLRSARARSHRHSVPKLRKTMWGGRDDSAARARDSASDGSKGKSCPTGRRWRVKWPHLHKTPLRFYHAPPQRPSGLIPSSRNPVHQPPRGLAVSSSRSRLQTSPAATDRAKFAGPTRSGLASVTACA
jgi:hypothetical protein